LAGQGIHVHPLLPGKKLPPRGCERCWRGTKDQPNPLYINHTPEDCPCLRSGGYCHGVRAATTNQHYITAWWKKMPDAAVGVAAGPSGLLILDVDRHGGELPATNKILPGLALPEDVDPATIQDGLDVLALLCEIRRAPLPDISPRTMTVRTPSGGVHYWYKVPKGSVWKPDSGALGWQLDVRAGWSYGIAPGSVTPKGVYEAVGDCRTIAPMPVWLAHDLDRTGHRVKPPRRKPTPPWAPPAAIANANGYVAAAVRRELQELTDTKNGRNQALYSAAKSLGSLVAGGHLNEQEVTTLLTDAANHIGLDTDTNCGPSGIEATIRSGLRNGARNPRHTLGAKSA
jgi:hypothetical protein